MSIQFDVQKARSLAGELRSAAKPVETAAGDLNQTANDISSMEDSEALKKDGYHRTLKTAGEFVLERSERFVEVAEVLEDIATTVEHYEEEVVGLLEGRSSIEVSDDFGLGGSSEDSAPAWSE